MHLSTTTTFALLPLIALAALALAHPEDSFAGPTAPTAFPQIPAAAAGPPFFGPPSGPTPPGPPPGAGPPSGPTPSGFAPGGYPPAGFAPGSYPPAGLAPGGYPSSGLAPGGYPPSGPASPTGAPPSIYLATGSFPGAGPLSAPAPPTGASTPDSIVIMGEDDWCLAIRRPKKPTEKYLVESAGCFIPGAIPDQGSSVSSNRIKGSIITNIFRQIPVAPSLDAGFTLATTVNGQELCLVRGSFLTARFYAKKCDDKSTKFTAIPTTSKIFEKRKKVNAASPSVDSIPVVKLKFKSLFGSCLSINPLGTVQGYPCATITTTSVKFRLVPVSPLTAPPAIVSAPLSPAIGVPPAVVGTAIPSAAAGTPPPPPSK